MLTNGLEVITLNIDDRKLTILQMIIDDYINTAEPVGSRSISKRPELNLSAATIRNEMGDLEEMGLLVQPHTSAGRVPSAQGYRLYVNDMMMKYEITANEMESIRLAMQNKINELDKIIRDIASAFAKITNLPVIGALPTAESGVVSNIKLVKCDKITLMVIISDRSGIIKNKILRLDEEISDEELQNLNNILNENLTGLTKNEIGFGNIMEVQNAIGNNVEILSSVLELVHNAVSEIDTKQIFVEGLSNIFRFPEYSDVDKIKVIFNALENKENLGKIVGTMQNLNSVKVLIGDEIPVEELKENSVILAPYRVSSTLTGIIGIIGPARMDYSKIISILEYFSGQMSTELAHNFGKELYITEGNEE